MHIKPLFPTNAAKDKGQKQCEIMSLLREELSPLWSGTTCVMVGFMHRRPRRVQEGRQGMSPIRPLCSSGCHKPVISHSAHRATLTPTACTPLSYPTNHTHLHSGHMLLHLTVRRSTGLWRGGVICQRYENNKCWRTEASGFSSCSIDVFHLLYEEIDRCFIWC